MINLLRRQLENKLKSQNQEAYNQYINLVNSGKSPDDIINILLQNGQISQDTLNQAKGMASNMINNNSQNKNRF